MGRIAKGTTCSVLACNTQATRSLSAAKIKSTSLQVPEQRRVYLCKDHYKEYKKKTKNDRRIEKWRWSA